MSKQQPEINHNVYILGAGFSFNGGIPLLKNFLERMADSVDWLYSEQRHLEAMAVMRVFDFRLRAASAAYRACIDVENIEELFSLVSASEGEALTDDVTTAIAATIDYTSSGAEDLRCVVEKKRTVNSLPDQWNTEQTTDTLYHFYAGILSGVLCRQSENVKNTILTFNYDTLLEDSLYHLGVPFNYGFSESVLELHESAKCKVGVNSTPSLQVLKLHGSVNWSITDVKENKVMLFGNYEDLRLDGRRVLLIPPTWRKVFGEHLTDIWTKAIEVLNSATRVIVIGFSMPPIDSHFKYLMAAGLQNNISLRKFLFINPELNKKEESLVLRRNLFSVLRNELETRGIIQLKGLTTCQFLLSKEEMTLINRPYLSDIISFYPPTGI
jgi:hypothetical protein